MIGTPVGGRLAAAVKRAISQWWARKTENIIKDFGWPIGSIRDAFGL